VTQVTYIPANENKVRRARLEGLDLARFLALAGMVIVNFKLVMGAQGQGALDLAARALEGRAAALFVVLAGIGIGLAAANKPWNASARIIVKRAAFLFALGLLNAIYFPPDILHYYAVYFLIAVLFLRAPVWLLLLVMFGLMADFVVMSFVFDYDAGWDWKTYEYSGFGPVADLFEIYF